MIHDIHSIPNNLQSFHPEDGPSHRREFDDAVADFRLGQTIRRLRLERGFTQTQLGERAGVKKARICDIEKGCNLRLSSLRRIFSALGITARLDLGDGSLINL